MKVIQKLGKAIMLPVACLPLCGILMGIGYFLCPSSMQGGVVSGVSQLIGLLFVKAGGALIGHVALLFAVGVAVGMSEDGDGTAALAALVSWFTITTLLRADIVIQILPTVAWKTSMLMAFDHTENTFIGVLAGLLAAACYNRFKNTQFPEWFAFFGGKRSVIIMTGLTSLLVSIILLFIWPFLFGGLIMLGQRIASMGPLGAGLYAFLNRMLIPLGLHHVLNNVFWFDTIGLGDLTQFWAGKTSADVHWPLGIYMSGFFPCMMFGVPGAALAIIQCVKKENRKTVIGLLASAAMCSFLCGITEPFEYIFIFSAPALYFSYALLYGVFSYIVALTDFRAGFAFSAGMTDFLFSASLPAAQYTWLILPLGVAAFAVFYITFRLMITAMDLKLPLLQQDHPSLMASSIVKAVPIQPNAHEEPIVAGIQMNKLLEGIGGRKNLVCVDNCITRLRLEVKNQEAVNEQMILSAGAKGVFCIGKYSVQVIIGTNAQLVADALKIQSTDDKDAFK